MDLHDAEILAKTLMTEWLPPYWSFGWARTRRILGRCTHDTCTIELSAHRTQTRDRAQVENVIRHEIAHALAGPGHGHDATWKSWARHVGGDVSRCATDPDGDAPIEKVYKYVATCGTCGKKSGQHRQGKYLKGGTACGDCCRQYAQGRFDKRFLLTFVQQW